MKTFFTNKVTKAKLRVLHGEVVVMAKLLSKMNLTVEDVAKACSSGAVYAECNDGKTVLKAYTLKELEQMCLDGTL